MTDETRELRRINWGECFGFTQIFRSFRMAIQPTKLMLAFCGLVLTYASGRILDLVWADAHKPVCLVLGGAGGAGGGEATTELRYFLENGRQATREWVAAVTAKEPTTGLKRVGPFSLLLDHARTVVNQATSAVASAQPVGLWGALRNGLVGKLWLLSMHPGYAVLFGAINLVVWALFGGAICRAAALDAAREEGITVTEALSFSRRRLLGFIGAPLLPAAFCGVLALFLLAGGFIGAIPGIGNVAVALLFWLALVAGFIMAGLIIGAIVGSPLTFPTIAVEGSDAFDAFSRSYGYVYLRPWRLAFYGLVAAAYGAICLLFVKFLVRLALAVVYVVVGWAMSFGSPTLSDTAGASAQRMSKLEAIWQGPSLTGDTAFWGSFGPAADVAGTTRVARGIFHLWILAGVFTLVGAFVVSFYYSASTIIYLLLRREVDATDLEDVYTDELPAWEPPLAGEAGGRGPDQGVESPP